MAEASRLWISESLENLPESAIVAQLKMSLHKLPTRARRSIGTGQPVETGTAVVSPPSLAGEEQINCGASFQLANPMLITTRMVAPQETRPGGRLAYAPRWLATEGKILSP